MENGRKQRSDRKPDNASNRRGINHRIDRALANRIDQVRGSTSRAAWIRNAITKALIREATKAGRATE